MAFQQTAITEMVRGIKSGLPDGPDLAEETEPAAADGQAPDGIGRSAGGEVTYTVDGKTWVVPLFCPGDYGAIEDHLRKQHDPVALVVNMSPAIEKAPPAIRAALTEKLFQKISSSEPSGEDVATFLNSLTGTLVCLWVQFRKRYPAITLEEVKTIFNRASAADLTRLQAETASKEIRQAAGE